MELTHLNQQNHPKMVDVGQKQDSLRVACASGKITMNTQAFENIINHSAKKGPVLQTAIIAAIMGSKKTSELIPMCHPLFISGVDVSIKEEEQTHSFTLFVEVKTQGKTGVEMEALMGVSIGLLTIYDMVKAIDKSMVMSDIKLESKSGGKSGDFQRQN